MMWHILFWALLATAALWEILLHLLQWLHLKQIGNSVPDFLMDLVPENYDWERGINYARSWLKLKISGLIFNYAVIAVAIGTGALAFLARWCASMVGGPFADGLLLGGLVAIILFVLGLPWAIIGTFGVEERFGFNRTTPGLFIRDQSISLLLSVLLSAFLLGTLSWLTALPLWPLLAFLVLAAVEIIFLGLFPVLIVPLFYKLTPLEEGDLKDALLSLMDKASFPAAQLMTADASRKSTHGNAFLAGLGRGRRVVLFDTLVSDTPISEICAVVGHELGHWRGKHLLKRLFLLLATQAAMALFFGLLWNVSSFAASFGMTNLPAGNLLVLILFWSSISTLSLQGLMARSSRRHEFEADAFGGRFSDPQSMAGALQRLASDNLAWSTSSSLYSGWYNDHPSIDERILELRRPRKDIN